MFEDYKTRKETKKAVLGKTGYLSRRQIVKTLVGIKDITKGKSQAVTDGIIALYEDIRKDKVKRAYSSRAELEEAYEEIVEKFDSLIDTYEKAEKGAFELVDAFMNDHLEDEYFDVQVEKMQEEAILFCGVVFSMVMVLTAERSNIVNDVRNSYYENIDGEHFEKFKGIVDSMAANISNVLKSEGDLTLSESLFISATVVQYHLKYGMNADLFKADEDALDAEINQRFVKDYVDLMDAVKEALSDIL